MSQWLHWTLDLDLIKDCSMREFYYGIFDEQNPSLFLELSFNGDSFEIESADTGTELLLAANDVIEAFPNLENEINEHIQTS